MTPNIRNNALLTLNQYDSVIGAIIFPECKCKNVIDITFVNQLTPMIEYTETLITFKI